MRVPDEELNISTIKQYAFIRDYINQHGYAPAYSEIKAYMGQRSTSTTKYHMKRLFDAGFLETDIEDTVIHPRAYRIGKNPLKKEENND